MDAVLVQQANTIGQQVYRDNLHVSPWLDLMKQSEFPQAQGYQLQTLVYDRAIPTTATTTNGSDFAGVNWHDIAIIEGANNFNASEIEGNQPLADASKQHAGPSGGDTADPAANLAQDQRSYLRFSRKLKPYRLKRAVIESPKISLEDLMFATHREEQLRAITELMTESNRYTWENRNRDEYERVCGNVVFCRASTTAQSTVYSTAGTAMVDFEGKSFTDDGADLDQNNASASPQLDLSSVLQLPSNSIMDYLYNKMNRQGAGQMAYGRENGRPVYAVVGSSEFSRFLQTETGVRDDIRYEKSRVSELIAPLGVEKSFRGFYHLNDDLAPRFTVSGGVLTRVLPYTVINGIVADNAAYDSAPVEAAFVVHPQVCESQIPNPFRGAQGITFDPVTYRGQFKWTNIPHATTNPDGTVGHFRAILGSATKPIKPHYGYMVIYDRTSSTYGDI